MRAMPSFISRCFLAAVAVAATFVATALGGCKPELIAGTTVEDTEENREVLVFLTRYQQAMQNRSAAEIVKLCAADYFEDNGNADPKDDYNLDGLRGKLEAHLAKTKELTLEVYVQAVDRTDPTQIWVAYRFNTRALIGFPSGDKWLTATEVNKIKLRAIEDDEAGFRIVSGL